MKHTRKFPGRYDQVRDICDFVSAGAAEAGLDDKSVFHIELACDEACTNVIEHAYETEDQGEIIVSWHVKGGAFHITIRDNGRPFDPNQVPVPQTDLSPTPQAIDNLKVGGLGIHFMKKLMDEVVFQFNEHGNTLTMIKNITKNNQ